MDTSNSIAKERQKSDMELIVERLQSCIYNYTDIVIETEERLQMIKNRENKMLIEKTTEKASGSFVEEINNLIYLLSNLNQRATENLTHLKEIV